MTAQPTFAPPKNAPFISQAGLEPPSPSQYRSSWQARGRRRRADTEDVTSKRIREWIAELVVAAIGIKNGSLWVDFHDRVTMEIRGGDPVTRQLTRSHARQCYHAFFRKGHIEWLGYVNITTVLDADVELEPTVTTGAPATFLLC